VSLVGDDKRKSAHFYSPCFAFTEGRRKNSLNITKVINVMNSEQRKSKGVLLLTANKSFLPSIFILAMDSKCEVIVPRDSPKYCKGIILGASRVIGGKVFRILSYLPKNYHNKKDCFVCTGCSKPLGTQTLIPHSRR